MEANPLVRSTEPQLTFRQAQPGDSQVAAQLIHLSMGSLADLLLEQGPRSVDDCLAWLFERQGGRFSFHLTSIVEVQREAVGILAAFPGQRLTRLDMDTGGELLRLLGFRGLVRMVGKLVGLGAERETGRDEYHINNVAVLPSFQGRGIGAQLMGYAERSARASGLIKCSLLVDVKNETARRLYERLGYRVCATKKYAGSLACFDHHRMLKVLSLSPSP